MDDRRHPPIGRISGLEVIQRPIAPAGNEGPAPRRIRPNRFFLIFDFWQDLHCFAGIARDNRKFCAVLQDVINDFRDVVVDADPIAKISGNKSV